MTDQAEPTPVWIDMMWADLERMSSVDQFMALSEWIHTMTYDLLPMMRKQRRRVVVNTVALPDWDIRRFAEVVGARVNTIQRLVEEGRRVMRDEGSL